MQTTVKGTDDHFKLSLVAVSFVIKVYIVNCCNSCKTSFGEKSSLFTVLLGPEVSELVAGMIGDHSSLTGLPSGRADFTVFVSVLEGLDESEDFINVTADGEVGDAHVSKDTLVVNDVSSSKGDSCVTSILDESTVGLGDGFG